MNSKIISMVSVIVLLAVGAYFLLTIDENVKHKEVGEKIATFSSTELGFKFAYPAGPDGYVLEERTPSDTKTGHIKILTLFRSEDKLKAPPVGGEGPPVIAILVFSNPKKQQAQAWADENISYSTINLKMGEISKAVVGGVHAIRYLADGLYASENVIVAHGDNMYMITGQFIDQNSGIRRDFEPLLESIRFIPKSEQE